MSATTAPQGVWAGCPYCRRYVRLRHVMKTVPAAGPGQHSPGTQQVADPELITDAMALHARSCAS